jgi:hypothetical protein
LTSVILNNDDLNIRHTSHKFFQQQNAIQHLQSTNVFPISLVGSKIMFNLKGKMYEMPQSEALKVQKSMNLKVPETELSLGVYEIKFDTMEQINLFSGYTRKLNKEDSTVKVDRVLEQMQVNYDIRIGEILYQYSSDSTTPDCVPKTIKEIRSFLEGKIKVKEFSIKHIANITAEDIENLKRDIEEDETTSCIYDSKAQLLKVKCMEENDLMKTEWRIKVLESTYLNIQLKEPIKYPECWEPQKEEIEEFVVPANSDEFNRVQSLFKVGKIQSLMRIQNKIIYKKYYEEGLFLKNVNGGTAVKKMELFHGTRSTNPEEIYKDKEESFNINYSSDSNLLGRGIYFA